MDTLVFRPANEVPFEDLQAVLGASQAGRCQCQRQVLGDRLWWHMPVEERRLRLAELTCADDPDAPTTSGLVAYDDGEPVGWVAVAPRPTYRRYYGRSPVVWSGRHEDREDPQVWAVACFVVRAGSRGQGLMYELARAAVDFARERGATALEGYPIVARDGGEVVWDEASVGTPQVFAAAGFDQVSAPTARRRVVRRDL
ncbi:GNAT family N-acetyltransferase [Isoptericola aurantiacus]|uniref:GNAT family N-acetyltransferase n=1 Tax=Isoptericola aurantiacus TaxID=3377839 RepID=UPI00383B4580